MAHKSRISKLFIWIFAKEFIREPLVHRRMRAAQGNAQAEHLDYTFDSSRQSIRWRHSCRLGRNHLGTFRSFFSRKKRLTVNLVIILQNTIKIEYLDLSHNEFGEEAGKILGPAIAENNSIKYMDLSWNNLRRKGAIAIAKGLGVSAKRRRSIT